MTKSAASTVPRAVLLAAVVLLGLYDAAYLTKWAASRPEPPFGDFFAFRTFGQFAAAHGRLIYDPVALTGFQRATHPAFTGSYPFMYPPTLLLAVVPLAFLPFTLAYLVWITAGLSLCLATTLGRRAFSLAGAAIAVAPTTLLAVISGQNGLFTAALLAGGLRWLAPRPLLSGMCFGLVTYKPQFALVAPIVLAASRNKRAAIAAATTFGAVVVVSSLCFGWDIWPAWVRSMPIHERLMVINRPPLEHLTPGLLAGMKLAGGPDWLGALLQAIQCAAVTVLLWRAFRGGRRPGAAGAAMIGSLLLAPYVQIYDGPVIASAVALWWVERVRAGGAVPIREAALVAVLMAVIFDMVTSTLPFVAAGLLILLFWCMVREGHARTAPARAVYA